VGPNAMTLGMRVREGSRLAVDADHQRGEPRIRLAEDCEVPTPPADVSRFRIVLDRCAREWSPCVCPLT
jgi:hypothetical protein